jgi:hypothetical protein
MQKLALVTAAIFLAHHTGYATPGAAVNSGRLMASPIICHRTTRVDGQSQSNPTEGGSRGAGYEINLIQINVCYFPYIKFYIDETPVHIIKVM